MKVSLDEETIKEMSKSIYNLTTSGNPSLDSTELKKFKKFCRKSDDYVRFAFILVMEQLEKKHSEIRLSAFQVAAEIFTRSHAFREILVTYLQDFLALTTGTETEKPLPPPKAAANKLKESTLRTVQQWYDNYGKSYRKLDVGYNYLKNCKLVDFQNIQAQNEAERLRAEQEEKRKKKQLAERLAKVLKVISENKPEIENSVSEAENCLKLLMPTPDDFELFSPEDATQPSTSKSYSDQVELSPLRNGTPGKSDATEQGNNDSQIKTAGNLSSIGVGGVNDIDTGNKKCFSIKSTTGEINETGLVSKTDVNSDVNSTQCEKISKISKFKDNDDPSSCFDNKVTSTGDAPENHNKEEDNHEDHEEETISEEEDDYDSDESENERAHGFGYQGVTINIEIPMENVSVKETEDNTDVLQSLKDVFKLVNSSYLPRVTKWLEVLGKNGGNHSDIKSLIDLKQKLESIKTKCSELKLLSMERPDEQNTDDEEDEDLEDVPEKEGYEATVLPTLEGYSPLKAPVDKPGMKRHHSAEATTSKQDSNNVCIKKAKSFGQHWNLKERESEESLIDPTSRATALARIKSTNASDENPSTSSSQPSTSKLDSSPSIPFVEFGKDLAYWENPDQIEAPEIVKLDSLHRFWTGGDKETEKTSQHDLGLMLNRTFKFTGKFEPVKWSCRAPLKSGKLCPRMDRVKCPFHGPIIPRDEQGNPMVKNEPTTSTTTESITHSGTEQDSELPPWRDPELQREIEQATGHDLGSALSQKLLDKARDKGKGKGKGKSGKKSGLTDIKAASNTSRKRLEKKVFNKRSMRRVCSTLDTADYKRVRDKFGNQFNYSL